MLVLTLHDSMLVVCQLLVQSSRQGHVHVTEARQVGSPHNTGVGARVSEEILPDLEDALSRQVLASPVSGVGVRDVSGHLLGETILTSTSLEVCSFASTVVKVHFRGVDLQPWL